MYMFPRMPGLGDVPSLADWTLDDLIEEVHESASIERKRIADERKAIWDECFEPQIARRTRQWWTDRIIQDLVIRHASVSLNPGKDTVQEIACVYTHGSLRLLTDVEEEVQEDWNKLLNEDPIDVQAEFANQMAMLIGTTHVVPVVRNVNGHKRLTREVKLANCIDVGTDPADPMGWPTWAIWEVYDGTNQGQTDDQRVHYVVVDQYRWIYLNRKGKPVNGPDGVPEAEHGCKDEFNRPCCPAVPWEAHERTDDYWGLDENRRFHETTIIVGTIAARLSAVRSTQDHHQLVLSATSKEAIPSKQLTGGDPQRPLEMFNVGAGRATADALATLVSPQAHIDHMMLHIAALEKAYGIQGATSLDTSSDVPVFSIGLRNSQRNALRKKQLRPARRFERRLAVVTASIARHAGHPLAKRLPPPDEVWEQFDFEVPELNTIDDPKARREQDDHERKIGAASIVDIVKRDKWPNRSRSQIMDLIKRNVEEEAEVMELLAKRNQVRGGPVVESDEEFQGRQTGPDGPAVRDGKMPPPDGGGDDDSAG